MTELDVTAPELRQRTDALLSVKNGARWFADCDRCAVDRGDGLRFDPVSAVKVVAVVSGLASISWFYAVMRPVERFQVLCAETAVLLAFSAAAAVLSVLVIPTTCR